MRTSTKSWGILFALTVIFLIGRLALYGIATDSVAANDTDTYLQCAQTELDPVLFFQCNRSATIPFLFRLLNPEGNYQITNMSEPFFGSESRLAVQPGTEKLVIFQTLLSMFSWVFFTLTFSGFLKHELPKIISAILIYGFALVPQIADWDSVLLSESLSFSFFILLITFLLHFIMNTIHRDGYFRIFLSIVGLLVSAIFWTFTRDTNSYLTAFIALVFLGFFFFSLINSRRYYGSMLMMSVLLIALFAYQQITFQRSQRWLLPFMNNMTGNVLPYPERVAFFEERGMPVNETLLAQTGSAEYNLMFDQQDFVAWAKTDGMKTYLSFLLDRPVWSIQQFYLSLDDFFSENIQPFFYGNAEQKPHWAVKPGNLLHPLSAAVILIDLLLLIIVFSIRLKQRGRTAIAWWLFSLILVGGSVVLVVVSYFGEVRSIIRHVLGGVMPLRLSIWLVACILFDQVLEIPAEMPIITRLAGSQTPLISDKIE